MGFRAWAKPHHGAFVTEVVEHLGGALADFAVAAPHDWQRLYRDRLAPQYALAQRNANAPVETTLPMRTLAAERYLGHRAKRALAQCDTLKLDLVTRQLPEGNNISVQSLQLSTHVHDASSE